MCGMLSDMGLMKKETNLLASRAKDASSSS
jgi:hypothetical protein